MADALARMAASTEFGLLTRPQLLRQGIQRHQVDNLVRRGFLHPAARGVYSLEPPGWLDRVRALVRLQFSGSAVVSHRSAARLHGLHRGDEVELTVRYPASGVANDAFIHRSRDLVSGVVTSVDRLPVTTVARTLCDLGLVLPPWDVRHMIEHAVATGRVCVDELESVRWGVSEHGRNGVSAVDQAIAHLPAGAAETESGPEARLLTLLEDSSLPTAVPQFEVLVAGARYRLDFAIPQVLVAVEYDGHEFHSTEEQRKHDAIRQERLEAAGWLVLRFDRTDLYRPDNGAVLREVATAVRNQRERDL